MFNNLVVRNTKFYGYFPVDINWRKSGSVPTALRKGLAQPMAVEEVSSSPKCLEGGGGGEGEGRGREMEGGSKGRFPRGAS